MADRGSFESAVVGVSASESKDHFLRNDKSRHSAVDLQES